MAGVAGDVEKDFWLAYDLLRSPKDHAEFVTVRDWVHTALQARPLFPFETVHLQMHSSRRGTQVEQCPYTDECHLQEYISINSKADQML